MKLNGLPPDWQESKIGKLAEVRTGKTPSRTDVSNFEGTIPWVKTAEVVDSIIFDTEEHLSEKGKRESGSTVFPAGSILVALYGQGQTRGRTALLGVPAATNQACAVILPSPQADRQYLWWWLRASYIPLRELGRGGNQPNLNLDIVREFGVPVPPLDQQRHIAAILDKADAIRRKREEGIRLTEELLRSTFLEMFGDPASNPRGWPIRQMDGLVRETQYGTAQKSNGDQSGIPVLRMNNLTYEGGIDLSDLKWCEIGGGELPQYTVRRGDLLFNRTNSPELVGKTAVWNRDDAYAFAGYLIRVRFDEVRILPEYVSAFLNSTYGKKMLFSRAKPSNNMSNFSAGEFRRIEIPVPDIELQLRYSNVVHQGRTVKERRADGLAKADNLFQALVQRAFRGEL